MYCVLLSSLAFLPALSQYRFIQPRNSGAGADEKKTIKVKLDNISLQLVFVWRRIFNCKLFLLASLLIFLFNNSRVERKFHLNGYLHRRFQLQKAKGILYETFLALTPSLSYLVYCSFIPKLSDFLQLFNKTFLISVHFSVFFERTTFGGGELSEAWVAVWSWFT